MIYVTQLCTAASNAAKGEELLMIVLFDMKVFYKDCFQNSGKKPLIGKRKCSGQGLSGAHPLE